jgi:hypothetical protein
MSTPTASATLPVFVPRTVAAFERAATQVARRVVTPVHSLGEAALSFANRVVGGWLGATSSFSGGGDVRPSAAAERASAGLVLPRPWYEADLERRFQPQPARAPRPAIAAPTVVGTTAEPSSMDLGAPVSPAPQTTIETAAAVRGASIVLTNVEALPERTVAATTTSAPRPSAPSAPATPAAAVTAPSSASAASPSAPATPASSEARPAPAPQPSAASPTPSFSPTPSIESTMVASDAIIAPTAPMEAAAPAVERALGAVEAAAPTASAPVAAGAAAPAPARELTAAQALGLARPAAPAVSPSVTVAPRPAFARALQHAQWVDARLRTLASPTAAPVLAAGEAPRDLPSGYVFVAPSLPTDAAPRIAPQAVAPRAPQPVASVAAPPASAPVAVDAPTPAAPTPEAPAPSVTVTQTSGGVVVRVAAPSGPVAPLAAPTPAPTSPVALPDLRLASALASLPSLASATVQRALSFVERLVGTQAVRDAQPLPVTAAPAAPTLTAARAEQAPAPEYLRADEAPPAPTRARAADTRPAVASTDAPAPKAPAVAPPTAAAPAAAPPLPIVVSEIVASPTEAAPSLERAAAAPTPVYVTPTEARPVPQAGAAPAAPAPSPTAAQTAATAAPAPAAPPTVAPAAPRSAMRPGAIAARAEQLGSVVDARAAAVWGEPLPVELRAAPQLQYLVASVADPAQPLTVTVAGTPIQASPAARAVSAAGRQGPALLEAFVEHLVGAQAMRATAPQVLEAQALPGRIAQQIVLPEPVRVAEPPARPSGPRAPAPPLPSVAAPIAPAPIVPPPTVTPAQAAPAPAVPAAAAATVPTAPKSPLRLGGLGVRAEQIAGYVGVRAANLSIDFVDPALLPSLMAGRGAPDLSVVAPATPFAEAATAPRAWATTAAAPIAAAPADGGDAFSAAATATPAASEGRTFAERVASGGVVLSAEEWALVATFPSSSTALQVSAARRSAQFLEPSVGRAAQSAPSRVLLTASPATSAAPSPARAGRATMSLAVPTTVERAAAAMLSSSGPQVPAAAASAAPTVDGEPESGPAARGGAPAARGGAPRELVAPGAIQERTTLPGGRQPRGSFLWPRAASFVTPTGDWSVPASVATAQSVAEAAPGAPLWGAMRPLVSPAAPAPAEASGESASTARALAFAQPFLNLVQGGLSPVESSGGARFVEQAQPLVVPAAPASDAASKIVEAVRTAPTHTPNDDRISLADLTLIATASATQQIAASPAGGGPAPSAPSGGGGGGHGGGGGGHGKGDKKGGGAHEIEELAQKIYDELQKHWEIQRERSGESWDS